MRRSERGESRASPPGHVRGRPDELTSAVLDGAPHSIGTVICLVHDHPEDTRPAWLAELASACRLVEIHPSDGVRLRRFQSRPWLVDVRTLDTGRISGSARLGRAGLRG